HAHSDDDLRPATAGRILRPGDLASNREAAELALEARVARIGWPRLAARPDLDYAAAVWSLTGDLDDRLDPLRRRRALDAAVRLTGDAGFPLASFACQLRLLFRLPDHLDIRRAVDEPDRSRRSGSADLDDTFPFQPVA